jgi:N-acetylglucosaminyldiphosphoundecaprenol N-acetyl-beta-D-mannosaminyltransferase
MATMANTVQISENGAVTLPSFEVLGVRMHPVQIPDILRIMDHWIQERKGVRVVCQTGMHGSSEAIHNLKYRAMLNDADLNNMDGMSMKVLARIHGFEFAKNRASGPEVMSEMLKTGAKYRHFFYGNRCSEELAEICRKRWGTQVVGVDPVPDWPLPESEKQKLVERIESVKPDIVWVGLGTMRQEPWMNEFRHRLTVPIVIGVGAAFDFHVGKLQRAPMWMQQSGLEWFFRLVHEPRRLWRRYLVNGPMFVWNVGLELAGLKKFSTT